MSIASPHTCQDLIYCPVNQRRPVAEGRGRRLRAHQGVRGAMIAMILTGFSSETSLPSESTRDASLTTKV